MPYDKMSDELREALQTSLTPLFEELGNAIANCCNEFYELMQSVYNCTENLSFALKNINKVWWDYLCGNDVPNNWRKMNGLPLKRKAALKRADRLHSKASRTLNLTNVKVRRYSVILKEEDLNG